MESRQKNRQPDRKKNRRIQIRIDAGILAVVYFLLATAMYYFNTEYLDFGIHFMVKFVLAAVMAALSFAIFIVHTQLNRMMVLLKYIMLLMLPHLVVLITSMPLWVFKTQGMTMIRRGIFDQLYGMIIVMAMAGMVYVFGRRGFWINMAAMLLANLVTIVTIIRENSFAEYWEELRTLVTTFAEETGVLMSEAEIHELTFAIGVVIVVCLANVKETVKSRVGCILLPLALFCFFSGFKRIGAAALAAALVIRIGLKALTLGREKLHFWPVLAAFCTMGIMFGYICMVKGGIFEYLSAHFNLNTMGRSELSAVIDQYYWIGPDYFGNGAGFVNRTFSDMHGATIRALHNDVLVIYLDIGFWGFWAWMLAYLPVRTWLVCRWQGTQGGILCFCECVFVLVTAMTDNTIYYVYVTGAVAIAIMSYRLEEQERTLAEQRAAPGGRGRFSER